jgi:hypothetical protein
MSRTPTPLYREFASLLNAIDNCRKSGNTEWLEKHETSLDALESFLPSGSGINIGTKLDRDKSTSEKLVFSFSFHHMDERGGYDGWTDHVLTIRPSLQFGIDIRISGRDRNQIKDYLYETYGYAFTSLVWQTDDCRYHSSQFETAPTIGGAQ